LFSSEIVRKTAAFLREISLFVRDGFGNCSGALRKVFGNCSAIIRTRAATKPQQPRDSFAPLSRVTEQVQKKLRTYSGHGHNLVRHRYSKKVSRKFSPAIQPSFTCQFQPNPAIFSLSRNVGICLVQQQAIPVEYMQQETFFKQFDPKIMGTILKGVNGPSLVKPKCGESSWGKINYIKGTVKRSTRLAQVFRPKRSGS
jgi:hypothetical protein